MCLLTAIGASFCYLLSWLFGRRLVLHYLGDRIKPLQERVSFNKRLTLRSSALFSFHSPLSSFQSPLFSFHLPVLIAFTRPHSTHPYPHSIHPCPHSTHPCSHSTHLSSLHLPVLIPLTPILIPFTLSSFHSPLYLLHPTAQFRSPKFAVCTAVPEAVPHVSQLAAQCHLPHPWGSSAPFLHLSARW